MKNSVIKYNEYVESDDLNEAGVSYSYPAVGRYQSQASGLRMITFKTRLMSDEALRKYGLFERYGRKAGDPIDTR